MRPLEAEFFYFLVAAIVLVSPFWGALNYGEPLGWSWMFEKDIEAEEQE